MLYSFTLERSIRYCLSAHAVVYYSNSNITLTLIKLLVICLQQTHIFAFNIVLVNDMLFNQLLLLFSSGFYSVIDLVHNDN